MLDIPGTYFSWNVLQPAQQSSNNTPSPANSNSETQAQSTAAVRPTQETITCPVCQAPEVLKCAPPPTPKPCPPPPSPYDPKKVAFLVETRPLPHLPALFAHMASIIPPEWVFKLMGTTEVIEFMRSSPLILRLENSRKITFLDLPSTYTLKNRETISQMFTDPHLYRDILHPAEHLLVFQPDSIFCANAPRTLNDFLEWDWIGAPWSKTATYGGNGGLSLRKVSKILKVLDKEKRKVGDGALEDLWLSSRINGLEGKQIPVANVSKTFSVESVWDDAPLGYHIGWLGVHHEQIWDDQAQVDHVMQYCPEVKMILGMKLDNDKPKAIKEAEEKENTA
ncbi:hypothetical protein G7Y89_g14432 [Cudoniella acicularis]|uniref:DUF5672 domain-containing protein n=1 Tax=Cudoniella acicularis TaxID=354080 RepID=A0A8H4VVY3_9HELO|nr:hypothetical protein G7Y89_g14432 [Cudoniella acicularis]